MFPPSPARQGGGLPAWRKCANAIACRPLRPHERLRSSCARTALISLVHGVVPSRARCRRQVFPDTCASRPPETSTTTSRDSLRATAARRGLGPLGSRRAARHQVLHSRPRFGSRPSMVSVSIMPGAPRYADALVRNLLATHGEDVEAPFCGGIATTAGGQARSGAGDVDDAPPFRRSSCSFAHRLARAKESCRAGDFEHALQTLDAHLVQALARSRGRRCSPMGTGQPHRPAVHAQHFGLLGHSPARQRPCAAGLDGAHHVAAAPRCWCS